MGTTLTALLFSAATSTWATSAIRAPTSTATGAARQLTEDHSWIQEQVRAGLISPEEAKESRFRNIITRSVGFEPSVEPDLQRPAGAGGRLLRALFGRPVELPDRRGAGARC